MPVFHGVSTVLRHFYVAPALHGTLGFPWCAECGRHDTVRTPPKTSGSLTRIHGRCLRSAFFSTLHVFEPLAQAWEEHNPGTLSALERLTDLGFVTLQKPVTVDTRLQGQTDTASLC